MSNIVEGLNRKVGKKITFKYCISSLFCLLETLQQWPHTLTWSLPVCTHPTYLQRASNQLSYLEYFGEADLYTCKENSCWLPYYSSFYVWVCFQRLSGIWENLPMKGPKWVNRRALHQVTNNSGDRNKLQKNFNLYSQGFHKYIKDIKSEQVALK